jgi:hypothetical protein
MERILGLRDSSFTLRLHNRLEGGGERGDGCHPFGVMN